MNSLLATFLNERQLTCLHSVKWFHVSLFNTNNSIYTLIICLHADKWLSSSIWTVDGSLICITTPGQSAPESNGNEGVTKNV